MVNFEKVLSKIVVLCVYFAVSTIPWLWKAVAHCGCFNFEFHAAGMMTAQTSNCLRLINIRKKWVNHCAVEEEAFWPHLATLIFSGCLLLCIITPWWNTTFTKACPKGVILGGVEEGETSFYFTMLALFSGRPYIFISYTRHWQHPYTVVLKYRTMC